MLAVLSLVHQTSRVTSSDCSYDRCGSLMKVCLHASVFYVLLPTATSHASSLAGALIRPRIASEEVQASPDAKSLLEVAIAPRRRPIKSGLLGFALNVNERITALVDQQTSSCGPQAQSLTAAASFVAISGAVHGTNNDAGRTGCTAAARTDGFRCASGVYNTEPAMPNGAAAYCRRSASARLRSAGASRPRDDLRGE